MANNRNKAKSKPRGSVRRNQLITTYGVGALVPVDGESFIIAGTDYWKPDQIINEPRLEMQLNRKGRIPPATGDDGGDDIPVFRFPKYYYCSDCHRLNSHRFFCGETENRCGASCNGTIMPSRFIVVCENGHIDDFPYFHWAHTDYPVSPNEKHNLSFESKGESSALSDIWIKCSCGAARSLDQAFGENALKQFGKCKGRRPWLGDNHDEACNLYPRTVQRGASNVYFPNTVSFLSIPPWSDAVFQLINQNWELLERSEEFLEHYLNNILKGLPPEERARIDFQAVLKEVRRRLSESKSGSNPASVDLDDPAAKTSSYVNELTLRGKEYVALQMGKGEDDKGIRGKFGSLLESEFVCLPVKDAGPNLERWFDRIMVAKRLREVKVLTSFTRLKPFSSDVDSPDRNAKLSFGDIRWLPATVVKGEGIFLQFNAKELGGWESLPQVVDRVELINRRLKMKKAEQRTTRPSRAISPRLVMLHSFAHMVINQLSLECGYSSSNLRERLYVADPMAHEKEDMAGVLIYTATGDAAGSLGGLVAQAQPDRLYNTLVEGTEHASWCSGDPLCIETQATGTDSLNLAACHACMLLPETSCEMGNIYLDRALLVGTPNDPSIGFFSKLLERKEGV